MLGHIIPEKFASISPPSPLGAPPFYFRVRWASTGSTRSPDRPRARAASEQGNGGGGGSGGLSIASYFRSAEEGSVRPKRRRKKKKNGRTKSVLFWAVGRSVGRGSLGGLLRRQQFRQEVLCHRRRVLRLQRRGVARRRMDLASRSRWLPIISETFLIAKVESSRLCKANSVRSNFVQTLRIPPLSLSLSLSRSL